MPKRVLGTGAAVVALLAMGAAGAHADNGVAIKVLSNRADLISAGDALVEVRLRKRIDPAKVVVKDGARDVSDAFAVRDGRFIGLVDGLDVGRNVLRARVRGKRRKRDRVVVVNHANGGPVFSGPQLQPWPCPPEALDAQCNQPTSYDYQYMSTSGGGFMPYDPENPPDDVATTTTQTGETVPFVVRRRDRLGRPRPVLDRRAVRPGEALDAVGAAAGLERQGAGNAGGGLWEPLRSYRHRAEQRLPGRATRRHGQRRARHGLRRDGAGAGRTPATTATLRSSPNPP